MPTSGDCGSSRASSRRNTSRPGLMLDANESWQVKQAVRYVSALEEHVDLLWVEEPLRRWDAVGHARLSAGIRAAVATGENLTGVEQFRPLFDAGAPDVVQAGAIWGVTHMLRLATAAAARDLPISPVGYNANPAVAAAMTAVPNHLTTEVQALDFAPGVIVDHEFIDGGIVLGDEPGSGIRIDEAAIESRATADGWATPPDPTCARSRGTSGRARRRRALTRDRDMEIRPGLHRDPGAARRALRRDVPARRRRRGAARRHRRRREHHRDAAALPRRRRLHRARSCAGRSTRTATSTTPAATAALKAAAPHVRDSSRTPRCRLTRDVDRLIDGRYGEFRDTDGFDDPPETTALPARRRPTWSPSIGGSRAASEFDLGDREMRGAARSRARPGPSSRCTTPRTAR